MFAWLFLSAILAHGQDYFPSNYNDSRAGFRRMCFANGSICRTHPIASPTDPDLTVDTALFSRGGSRLLVVQSGIHGPETPAGAAAQNLLFERYLQRFLDTGTDVLFIH